jgi:hypothetical protein
MSLKKLNLYSGILYLSLAFIGPFALLIIPSQFDVDGSVIDFATGNVSLIVLWLVLDILIIIIEVFLTIWLLKIFNEFNKKVSLAAFILRMTMVAIMIVNAVFLILMIIDGGTSADPFVAYHLSGVYLWQLFFGPHIFLLGYMVFKYLKSNWKYIGIVGMIGAFGYFTDAVNYLFGFESSILITIAGALLVFVTIGELSMAVALIMKKIINIEE